MMQKIRAIAIDDEPFALEIIKDFCSQIPEIDLLACYTNPFEAIQYVENNKIDLLFLDIQMPDVCGIKIANHLKGIPALVFTTAHSKYAVESYNLNAVDYLLKPYNFERFYTSIEKVKYKLSSNNQSTINTVKESITIKVNHNNIIIQCADIIYIEAMDNYVNIYTSEERFTPQLNLKSVLEILPQDSFMRVHKSYILSLKKIKHFKKSEATLANTSIPIGRTYQEAFLQRIKELYK